MTESNNENVNNNQEEIEKQKKLEARRKRLAEKRKLEEANLTEEERAERLKERKRAAIQKKLARMSEEEKQKLLQERKERARKKKLEEVKNSMDNSRTIEATKKLETIIPEQEDIIKDNLVNTKNSIENIEGEDMPNTAKKSNNGVNSAKSNASKVVKNPKKVDKKQEKINAKRKKIEAKMQKKSNKKKIGKVAKIILVILLILLIVGGILLGIRIKENGGGMQGIVATMLGHDSSTLEKLPELRFLIVGQSQNLTDTIMVCSYNPRSQKASILSIPRDTFTGKNKSSATAFNKINALYQQSPDKLITEVNNLTGLEIKYYVKVDTKGLKDLVNAIGGVDYNVPINMNYDDSSQNLHIHLTAGQQHLDGNKAEQLVRFRHNNNGSTYPNDYGQQDLGRMKTQREFIKVVIKKMAKAENITKVDDYIKIANKYVTTNMDFNACKDYAPYALSFNSDNVRTETLPGVPEMMNGLSFYSCNKKETQTLVKDMFSLEPKNDENNGDTTNTQAKDLSSVSVKGVKVEILNGTSNAKNLEELKNKLKEVGFTVSKTSKTSATSKTTIVNRTGKSEDIAEKLKNAVGAGTVSAGSNNSKVDFTIVIGSDYKN